MDTHFPRTIQYQPASWGVDESLNEGRGESYIHHRTIVEEHRTSMTAAHEKHVREMSVLVSRIAELEARDGDRLKPAIKPLVWTDEKAGAHSAECVFGHYVVNRLSGLVELVLGHGSPHPTQVAPRRMVGQVSLEELKRAAQEDYAHRLHQAFL